MSSAGADVLFLCTANYYRSRFAELVFNDLAARAHILPRADSAGLLPECAARNIGRISPHAIEGLRARGVAVPDPVRPPRDVTELDLDRARLVVALKESEHRPLLRLRFPRFETIVCFWDVSDVYDCPPADALALIEKHVRELVTQYVSR
jgi:protein-tyrosine phosphatase